MYQPEQLTMEKEYQDNSLGIRWSIGRCRYGHNLKIKVHQEDIGTLDLYTFHTVAYIYMKWTKSYVCRIYQNWLKEKI